MPKVTVLMSVYNGEKYLREAIESILNQTFRDFEFIIINDGSSDSSKDIILSYKDSRIRTIDNKQNIGLTKSLNKGLKMAKSEYIARIDADDILIKDCFKEKMEFMAKYPDVAALGNWMEIMDMKSGKSYILKYETDPTIIKWATIFKSQIAHSSAFFRKRIIDEVGYYNEKYKYAQDFDLWFRISRRYKIMNLSKVLLKYRIHSQRLSDLADSHKKQKQLVSDIIFNNINYYIDLDRGDFEILIRALRSGDILSLRNLLKVRRIYKDLFNSYTKRERPNEIETKKLLPDYQRKRRLMLRWYIKRKFSKIYNLCRNLFKRNI